MVRVALSPHPLLLVMVVVAVCAAIPRVVMGIDLSRLYGHISSKRGEFCFIHTFVEHLLVDTASTVVAG